MRRTVVGMIVGAHVPTSDLDLSGSGRDADAVQVFISNPRGYRAPSAKTLEKVAAVGHPNLWVHAPYLINVCSARDDVVTRSIACLQATVDGAAQVGARGVVVHAGQAGKDGDMDAAIGMWADALAQVDTRCRVLIENTAGGATAPGRHVDDLARLFDRLAGVDADVGFCLDTCHSWAGEGVDDRYMGRLLDAVGTVDLVHVNGSKDEAGSGRDRHDNLGAGLMPLHEIVAMVTESGALAAVVETPGGADEQAADVALLAEHVGR